MEFVPILTLIFNLVLTGVDPKSVFCAFFKQGLCKKGDKCKFSHDPAVEHKSAKRSIYSDAREGDEDDNMEDWDEDKLADVVNKKHGSEKTNQTDIVSQNIFLVKTELKRFDDFNYFFRFASSSWTLWKITSMDGSGVVQWVAKTANTDTHYRPDLY